MARKKSEFLGSLGTTFQIFKTIADAVMEEGGSDDDLRKVLQPGNCLATDLGKVIAGKAVVFPTNEPKSLEHMTDEEIFRLCVKLRHRGES